VVDRLAGLLACAQQVPLVDLVLPVAVDLGDGDIGQPVVLEERQKVVR
jgi:hypothetical protein